MFFFPEAAIVKENNIESDRRCQVLSGNTNAYVAKYPRGKKKKEKRNFDIYHGV